MSNFPNEISTITIDPQPGCSFYTALDEAFSLASFLDVRFVVLRFNGEDYRVKEFGKLNSFKDLKEQFAGRALDDCRSLQLGLPRRQALKQDLLRR